MIVLEENPDMSGEAGEQLEILVNTFLGVRRRGEEFMAMLTPVGFGVVGCAMAYQGGARGRAAQTLCAAVAVREHWHPTEVLWAADAYSTSVPGGERVDCLVIGYTSSEIEEVQYVELRYAAVGGEVRFEETTGGWFGSTENLMDAAISAAVSPERPDVPVPTGEQMDAMRVFMATGAEYN